MALIDITRPAAAGTFSVTALLTRFAAWQRTRRTETALNKLSARQLSDIGIDGDIAGVAQRLSTRY